MVNRKTIKSRKKLIGGYRKYKSPSFFAGSKIEHKKRIKLPSSLTLKRVAYLLLICFIVYYLFLSKKFSVKEVIIEGNYSVADEEITKFIPEGANIFRINSGKISSQLLNDNKTIRDIQIYKGFPNAIKVVMSEHEGKILWETDSTRYLINSNGMVIDKISDINKDESSLPLIKDMKNIKISEGDIIISPSFVAFIANVNNQIFDFTNIKPSHFEVTETTFDVNLYTEAGFYIKLDTTRSSAKQLDSLKRVLVAKRDAIHEYVDLRVDGWAYYK